MAKLMPFVSSTIELTSRIRQCQSPARGRSRPSRRRATKALTVSDFAQVRKHTTRVSPTWYCERRMCGVIAGEEK